MDSTSTTSTEANAPLSVATADASTSDPMNIRQPCQHSGKRPPMANSGASQKQRPPQPAYAGKSSGRTSELGISDFESPYGAVAVSRDGQSRRADSALDDAQNGDFSSPAAPLDRPHDEEFDAVEQRARMALESIATRAEEVEPNMGEHIEVLQSYRTACQARAMYREAYLVQQVLRNLRLEEESRHVRGITEQQMEERRMLEEAHRQEFREFHHSWNARIDAFEEEQLEAELALLERQNEELLRFQKEMRDFQPRLIKFSRSLLESRLRQQTLAKQRDYVGAQAQKVHAEAIELADGERFEAARATMFERREYAMHHRHQQELYALRMKVESRRLYLERYRKQELDVLLQRYINIRRSMESQQNIVRNKTGTLLLKHACNMKTDNSGTAVLVESAGSGAFGTVVQRRQAHELHAPLSQPERASAEVHDGSRLL
ncbi:hypothetical protein LSCM4_00460 [Leishmania orientalis]|uniref:Uncharacterized protein n=1 Tax=Leishmania orientalis TaxID=2249476 RepID=A0A836G453_9TRYP|nr:hypothetical protein LSCM4_00460 [Leishmania orientalis]